VGGSVPLERVEPMVPETPESYTEIKKNGISIYIDNTMEVDQKEISITLAKLLWLKKLSLEIE